MILTSFVLNNIETENISIKKTARPSSLVISFDNFNEEDSLKIQSIKKKIKNNNNFYIPISIIWRGEIYSFIIKTKK